MPAAMQSWYLRKMYQESLLSQPGALELGGVALDLGAIRTPLYIQAAKEDHIAPYASAFKLTNLAQGPTRFVLAGSGHIADAVNPPSANKYQHWRNDSGKRYERAEDWLAEATERPGSWCPDWSEWLAPHSGLQVPSRKPGDGGLSPIEDAPGSYVLKKS